MNSTSRTNLARLAGALVVCLPVLVGCGGGDAAPPSAAAANAAPVAAFTSADSVVAGAPLAFDASSASDADGDALTYSWNFGDGQHGGGKQIAALFSSPGSYTVSLTVTDGKGGSASVDRNVAVTAGPAAMGSVGTLTLVRDPAGVLLAGVMVANVAGGAAATTDADGRATVAAGRAVPAILKFSKPGYADQFKAFTLPETAESGYLEVTMTAREPAATLADAAAGGTVNGKDGASVGFEAGSLVNAAGIAVTGAVEVAITPIDVAANVRAFPGRFEGTRPTGQQGIILSYGSAEFILSQGGAAVQLAPGRRATIELPIYTAFNVDGSAIKAGDVFPLWSLNERTGTWIEEGSGSVVVASTPSGFALRGEVMHFSWWNHDVFGGPPARPKPKCLVDTNLDGVLEDLTGTGYCWHAGTGPEQPTPFAPFSAGDARKRALAEPRTQRIPAWVAEDFTPAGGGKVLPIPADMDITFRSYAMNGTLFGTKVVRMAANVEEDVPILLEPVQSNPGTLAVTLPFDDRFAVATRGEIDRFSFAAEAGASYDVRVSRSTSSLLAGSVRVVNASGASAASGDFATTGFAAVVAASGAGTMAVEVTAGYQSPGTYRIEVTKLASSASCSNPATLAVPSSGNHPIAGNGSLCFDIPLVADDAIEISNTQQINARGNVRLFAPSGDEVAIDSYGTGSFDAMSLRFGVAQGGTYRLLIVNTAATAGSINGLAVARLALSGTLGLSDSASFADVASQSNTRYYLVRPGAASHLAIKLVAGNNIAHVARVQPGNLIFTTATASGRVVKTQPSLLPLVEVARQNGGSAWQYTLSARSADVIALDTDLALATPAPDDVLLYRIDATAGQQWSSGVSYDPGITGNPLVSIYAPASGQSGPLTASNRVFTLPESGPYTVEVRSNTFTGTGGAPFTLRVNNAAAPEAIVLAASTVRTSNLALGEVRRYGFDVTQGQVLAMQLSTPGLLEATAIVSGGNIHDGFVVLAFPAKQRSSGARYVQQSAAAVLTLYGTSTRPDRATGQVTLTLQAPTPTPTALGAPISVDAPPTQLLSYGFAIAAPGPHLVCLSYAGATGVNGTSAVQGAVWGPSSPFSNYTGDLGVSGFGTSLEAIGTLRAGSNTLSFINGLAVPAAVNARLVALPPATDLAIGAAATNASVAACERRYHQFAGTAGQAYTLRVTAAFAGSVRVHKISTLGDVTIRTAAALGGTPLALAAGVERVVTFTIPVAAPYGSGSYIVEIDGDGDAAGGYTTSLTTP